MYDRKMLGLADAQKIVHAILEHVQKRKDPPVSMAVVDFRGDMVLFARMDGASWNTVHIARLKAYTAAKLRHDTSVLHEWMDGIGAELVDWGDPNLTAIGGGVCIRDEANAVVGAVGISGYPKPQDDEEACRVGIAAMK